MSDKRKENSQGQSSKMKFKLVLLRSYDSITFIFQCPTAFVAQTLADANFHIAFPALTRSIVLNEFQHL